MRVTHKLSAAQRRVLWLASSAERGSEHPLGRAVRKAARKAADMPRSAEMSDFQGVSGKGLVCRLNDLPVVLGSRNFVRELAAEEQPVRVAAARAARAAADAAMAAAEAHAGRGQAMAGAQAEVHAKNEKEAEVAETMASEEFSVAFPFPKGTEEAVSRLEEEGKTVMLVAERGVVKGVLGVTDVPRPEARGAVKALEGMGLKVWMVTGDNRRTAVAVASQLGISQGRVLAEVLPSNKAAQVRSLQAAGERVAMVGDGINDSPALAAADLGVAIATGTEIAMEAAGMVLMRSDVSDVITAIDLSRTIYRRIRMNFVWAMGYNIVAIPLAAGVLFPLLRVPVPPEVAGAAMALSSVSVVTSSLLLRRYKRPNVAGVAAEQEARGALAGNDSFDSYAIAVGSSSDSTFVTPLNTPLVTPKGSPTSRSQSKKSRRLLEAKGQNGKGESAPLLGGGAFGEESV